MDFSHSLSPGGMGSLALCAASLYDAEHHVGILPPERWNERTRYLSAMGNRNRTQERRIIASHRE
ncbi:MAG: hypothetical protein ACHQQQ_02045 [Bacteroidota bacterium]